jgi:hypothetical protein
VLSGFGVNGRESRHQLQIIRENLFSAHHRSVSLLPSGHDAWVVGNENVVIIDFQGMVDHAKKAA